MHLSVLFPVYNERETIARNLAAIDLKIGKSVGNNSYELVIIDNGSSDGTADLMDDLTRRMPAVRYWRTSQRGRGPALKLGFRHARGKYISVLSIDRAWDENFIEAAIPLLKGGAEIVYGSKSHPNSTISRSSHRRICSQVIRYFLALIFLHRPQDTQCIKAFRKSAIPFLDQLRPYNYFAETEFFIRAKRLNIPSTSIPVRVRDRRKDSKVKLSSLSEFLFETIHFRLFGDASESTNSSDSVPLPDRITSLYALPKR